MPDKVSSYRVKYPQTVKMKPSKSNIYNVVEIPKVDFERSDIGKGEREKEREREKLNNRVN